ncbi:MAG: BatD family protein [Acidiferrobacterales bacterium]|nr:BatD family protein [Acidiferrobacterales bacterium]
MVIKIHYLSLLFLLWPIGSWAETTARFNRDTIRLNETVELIIESDQTSISHDVDYSEIEKQFRIVSKRRDTNVTVMNGQSQLVHRWRAELAPRSVGSFGVGPITVEREKTNRLRLTVLPKAEEASTGEEVFIELEVDNDSVYVQQQILLTANLFVSVRLLDGSLVDPAPANTLVRRLGKDIRYETKRADKSYAVFQRRYALIPQKSGEMIIPALQFEGLADDIGVSNSGVFSPLFSQGRRIYANGKAIRIDVRPPAAAFTGKNWLPSDSVTISEDTGNSDRIEVGQPITRKIRLQGVNVTAEQLPEPFIESVEGIRSYPDQSRLITEDTETGVVGTMSIDIAMIGSRAGTMTLPEISIPWWNTDTDQMETAVLPARVIEIVENTMVANETATQNLSGGDVNGPTDKQVQSTPGAEKTSQNESKRWKWMTAGMALMWLVTLYLLFRSTQSRKRTLHHTGELENRKFADHYERVQRACSQNNAIFARNALSEWAMAKFDQSGTLSQIADQIDVKGEYADQFREQLRHLDQYLFSSASSESWQGAAMWRAFDYVFTAPIHSETKSSNALPHLYSDQ